MTWDGDSVVDLALQCERTRLSWDRTALSFATFGALLVHAGQERTAPTAVALGVTIVCAGCAVYLVGRHRYHNLVAALRGGGGIPRTRALALVAALGIVVTIASGLQAFLTR